MLTAYFIAFACILLIAITIFCFERVVSFITPFLATQLEIIIATVIIAVFLLLQQNITTVQLFTLPTASNWCWMSVAGLTTFLGGNYCSLLNIKLTNPSNNSLLSPVITVTASSLAAIFLNEHITKLGWIGLLITSISVFVYQMKQIRFSFSKEGFISGWISVICVSSGIICSIKGSIGSNISLLHTLFIRLFIVFIVVILIRLFSKESLRKTVKPIPLFVWGILLTAIICQTILGSYLWFMASYALGIAKFQVLIALLPFVVALLNAFVLKRKPLSTLFYITAFLAFIGVLLLCWQDLK